MTPPGGVAVAALRPLAFCFRRVLQRQSNIFITPCWRQRLTCVPIGSILRCFATAEPTSAHLSYDPTKVDDMATLLLMAQSANASDYSDEHFWRFSSLQAQRLMSKARVVDLSRFVEAVAMARFRDNELMYNFGDVVVDAIDHIEADVVGTALHAHALLGFRNDRVLQRLEAALFTLMRDSRVTAAALALSIRSLSLLFEAALLQAPSQELLEAVGRMALEHMNFFSVHQLSEIVEAYGTYRIQGDRQTSKLLSGIAVVLSKDYASLSAAQCAAAVKAFAKCRTHDERLLIAVGSRLRSSDVRSDLTAPQLADTLYGLAKFTCQDTALLDLLSIEARRRLHLMDVGLISTILSSIAKAGVSSQVLMDRAVLQLRRAEPTIWDAATVVELSNMAMAFGKLQARDEKLFTAIGDAIINRAGPDTLSREPCEKLVHILYAFTKVHVVHLSLFAAITYLLTERFEELTIHEILRFLHGAAKVDLELSSTLRLLLEHALHQEAIGQLGVFELLKLSAASRRLGLDVPAVESHVGAVLPREDRGPDALAPPRRPLGPKLRVKSVRKRKWTW